MNMNKIELAWAAGFMDGDGCFTYEVGVERPRAVAAQAVRQVDENVPHVLERLRNAVGGVGEIAKGNPPKYPHHKQQFYWRTTTFEEFQAVISMLWCFLSPYKRECILSSLKRFHERDSYSFSYSNNVLEYSGPVIRKPEAVSLGLDRYFTGKKCKHDHLSQRWVKSGKCLGCKYEYKITNA